MRGTNADGRRLRMALAEVLGNAGVEEVDFMREGLCVLAQELMELKLAEHVGASTTWCKALGIRAVTNQVAETARAA